MVDEVVKWVESAEREGSDRRGDAGCLRWDTDCLRWDTRASQALPLQSTLDESYECASGDLVCASLLPSRGVLGYGFGAAVSHAHKSARPMGGGGGRRIFLLGRRVRVAEVLVASDQVLESMISWTLSPFRSFSGHPSWFGVPMVRHLKNSGVA